MKNVNIKTKYITLGQLIKFLSLVSSGGEVKMFLNMNVVRLNGVIENRRGKKIYNGDQVSIKLETYVILSNEN